MKRIGWRWLAASSVLLAVLVQAETRPQYGGTLHVAMRAAPATLDPADRSLESFGGRSVTSLLFDTLLVMDDSGHPKAGLAEAWQATRGNQRWEFRLRQGVKFEDGTPLTADIAAASLRAANPGWNVSSSGTSVVIEQDAADPEMLAELALPRNAIAKRDTDNVVGTGPFHVVDWQPGKRLTVAANEEYWRGRPFLDEIEIEMGRGFRDQMTTFELRKADLIEVAPEQTHRFVQEGRGLTTSARIELLALVFSRDTSSAQEKALRQALALSVERGSIRSVLLQGAGDPTGSLLPTWISGYGFVFPTQTDLQKAKQLRAEVHTVPNWTIGYDSTDPLSRLVAERVALNAKDAGLSLQPSSGSTTDLRVMRIAMASGDPWVVINDVLGQLGMPATKSKGGTVEELYVAEQANLAGGRVIPLFHLPQSYLSAENLKDWKVQVDGSWDLTGAWLESSKP
jgi:peptide/nickel transport system substrate-binding protein